MTTQIQNYLIFGCLFAILVWNCWQEFHIEVLKEKLAESEWNNDKQEIQVDVSKLTPIQLKSELQSDLGQSLGSGVNPKT